MIRFPLSRLLALLAVVALLALSPTAARACPFCGMQGQTLTQEVDQAALVLYGKLKNARLVANPGGQGGETDLELDPVNGILKDHPWVKGKKIVTIPRYVPTDKDDPAHFLVFCDFFKGKLDPFRGLSVKGNGEIAKYLKGAVAVKDKKVPERLKFFFNWLQNEDPEIANDALREYGNSSYEDFRAMVASIPADTVAKWLKDKETPGYRVGLYASMLGHSSKKPEEHAKLLRSLVDDPDTAVISGIDGVLAGQILLQPKEGLEYVRGILSNRKKDFGIRFAALKALRFFHESRQDVVSKKDAVLTLAPLMEHGDMADLPIEEFRKWKCWEYTKQILELKNRKSHDVPIVHRAVLRFMLSSPAAEAKAYVEEVRKADPDLVSSAEEVLNSEKQNSPETRSPGSN